MPPVVTWECCKCPLCESSWALVLLRTSLKSTTVIPWTFLANNNLQHKPRFVKSRDSVWYLLLQKACWGWSQSVDHAYLWQILSEGSFWHVSAMGHCTAKFVREIVTFLLQLLPDNAANVIKARALCKPVHRIAENLSTWYHACNWSCNWCHHSVQCTDKDLYRQTNQQTNATDRQTDKQTNKHCSRFAEQGWFLPVREQGGTAKLLLLSRRWWKLWTTSSRFLNWTRPCSRCPKKWWRLGW